MGRRLLLALAALAAVMLSSVPPAASQTPPGDHYFCYKAALAPGQPKFTPVQKTLQDQLGTLVFDVKKIERLCNPALKNTEPPPTHPTVHEVGYQIKVSKTPPQPPFARNDHVGIDQFGTHALTLLKPAGLLVPSAKALGPGGTSTVDTTGVDHFECYKVATTKGASKFVPIPGVTVGDQFGSALYDLKKIRKLCTPVNKNGEDLTAPQHAGHLVCYQAKLAAGQTTFGGQVLSVNNANFGPAVLAVKAVAELCVPAFKDTVPTTTSTSTTSTSTSTSTTTTSSTSTSTSTSTITSTTTTTSSTTTTTTTTTSTTTTAVCSGGAGVRGCGSCVSNTNFSICLFQCSHDCALACVVDPVAAGSVVDCSSDADCPPSAPLCVSLTSSCSSCGFSGFRSCVAPCS